jgi:nitroreductase
MTTPQDLNTLIRSRRSVYPKQYSRQAVDQEIIAQMLENANWAPNHRKTEPWRFVVFGGSQLETLAQFQAEQYKLHTPAEAFDQAKYDKVLVNFSSPAYAIAIALKRHEKLLPEYEEIAAVSCAVQNMLLTAAAYGLGAFWSTGGITNLAPAKVPFFEWAGLPLGEEDLLMGFVMVGHYEVEIPDNARKPIQEKCIWRI